MISPRGGRWFAKPREVRWGLRKLPAFAFCVWIPYQAIQFVYYLQKARPPSWLTQLVEALLALYIAGWIAKNVWEGVARKRRRTDDHFSDRPAGIVEYPVELLVAVDLKPIGMDRGIVWFERGYLHFNGSATSFSLSVADLVLRKGKGKEYYGDVPRGAIRLATRGIHSYIRLMPLWGWRGAGFRRAMNRFLEERTPVQGERQWPPLERFEKAEAVLTQAVRR